MRPAALLARRRRQLETAIERAIAALDALDGDCDLEDGHDREDDEERESEPWRRDTMEEKRAESDARLAGKM